MKPKHGSLAMPPSLREWAEDQSTRAFPKEDPVFPYSQFWWRAVCCVLLSGRVRPKWDKLSPNLTDIERFCKEANFNQYYFRNSADFLVAGDVVTPEFNEVYKPGKRFQDFWSRDLARIEAVATSALVSLMSHRARPSRRQPAPLPASVLGLLRGFFTALEGKAVRADRIGAALLAFSELPQADLASFMRENKLRCDDLSWRPWLDGKGQTALINALYTAYWAYETTEDKQDWFCLNPAGRVMLGLEPAPPAPPEVKDFKALADLSVLAGVDIDPKTLAILFRRCRTERIDSVIRFRLDKTALKEMPAVGPPSQELLQALTPCAPLPANVLDILGDRALASGGVVFFHSCCALVKAESPELLSLIRTHPRLKGYFDREGPPGYLVIKAGANPYHFLQRCEEHGFKVTFF